MRPLELTERILRLRVVPGLREVASSDLAPLATSVRHVGFRRGEVLLREDEPPRSFFIIGEGTVALTRRDHRVSTVHAPGGVGFLSFAARAAGGTSAIAESYVEALEIEAEAMDEILEDHVSALLGTIRSVAEMVIAEGTAAPPPEDARVLTAPFDHLVGAGTLGIVERIHILRRIISEDDVNVNTLATLARRMTETRAEAGTVLWRPGDASECTYWLVKGAMSTRGAGVVQRLGPGDVVGGAESLVGAPRETELVLDAPSVLLSYSRDELIELFEDDFALARRFLAMLASFVLAAWDRRASATALLGP